MSQSYVKVCGIVLAGGLSRRYGSPKAFVEKNGQPYYAIASQLLASICDEVIIVTREEYLHRFHEEETVIIDEAHIAGKGPLAGIYSAMNAVSADFYLILPCDMPYMERGVLEALNNHRSEASVIAMTINGREHPLVSIWARSMRKPILTALTANRLRVTSVFEKNAVKWLEGADFVAHAETVFRNINKPSDDHS